MKVIICMKKRIFALPLFYFGVLFLVCFFGCNTPAIQKELPPENIAAVDSMESDVYIDSLLNLAGSALQDTNLVVLYHQIGEFYEDYDFETAKYYYLKMGELCNQLNWNKGQYMFAIDYSHLLVREGILDSAIVVNNKAVILAEKENNEYWIGRINYSLGNAFLLKQWFEIALEHYMIALSFFEKDNNTERLGSIYSQLCQLYTDIDLAEKAIEFGDKAVALNPECPYSLTSLAQAYSATHQYQTAISDLKKALQLSELQNNIYLQGVIFYHLGNNFLNIYDLISAEKYSRKALQINAEIGNTIAYLGALTLLGKLEKLKGNFLQSEKYIAEALQIAKETNNLEAKNNCYMILAELAIVQHRYRENVQYWTEWELVQKEISSEIMLRTAAEMEAKYESSKKALEIERQKIVIENQRIQQYLFAGGIIICVFLLVFLWYMLRQRNRRNLVLMEINATKDKFFSIISHDLKNPALAQQDALQMMIDNADSWTVETLKKYYHGLLQSANGQVNLLYSLLNWAQIQTGRMPFNPALFDFAAELRKTNISLLQDMATRKGIEFIVEMPETVLLFGDMNMLTTVVRNLLTNAIKFTTAGGKVKLEITPQTSHPKPHTSHRISISDTGCGMTEEQTQNLFNLNRRTSKRGTSGETGAGLGLIVCIELLEKHGTTLHVESKINEGTCFWFDIESK